MHANKEELIRQITICPFKLDLKPSVPEDNHKKVEKLESLLYKRILCGKYKNAHYDHSTDTLMHLNI